MSCGRAIQNNYKSVKNGPVDYTHIDYPRKDIEIGES
jgi:hypothetical protein